MDVEVKTEMNFEKFLSMLNAFEKEGVDYVLVGGIALNLHGILRATEDIDLFVRPDPENVERARKALQRVWDDPDIEQIHAEDLAGDYPTVRYGPPGEDFVIDFIARLGDTIRFEDLDVEIVSLEGVSIRLATPLTLYRMKRDTIRPIDQADASVLRDKFGIEEE